MSILQGTGPPDTRGMGAGTPIKGRLEYSTSSILKLLYNLSTIKEPASLPQSLSNEDFVGSIWSIPIRSSLVWTSNNEDIRLVVLGICWLNALKGLSSIKWWLSNICESSPWTSFFFLKSIVLCGGVEWEVTLSIMAKVAECVWEFTCVNGWIR